jgi:hypothetical protein
MRTIFRVIILFTMLSILRVNGQGIIIDHTCTDINQIPISVINDVKDNIKWQYGGLSHSNQLLCGILQAEAYNSIYNVEIGGEYYCCNKNLLSPPYLPEVPGALCLYSGANGSRNLGWSSSFTYNVQTTLDQNPSINVFQFQWCDELDTYSAAELQEFLDVMQNLSIANPNVTFVYNTANAKAGGVWEQEVGYNRYLRNEQIKQWCIDHNQVCFDFADLECWYNGEMASFIYEPTGETIPMQHSAYASEDCHHVNQLCTEVKGRAVWWMMARIRGWNPGSGSLNIKAFLQGNFAVTGMTATLNSQGLLPLTQPFNYSPINYNGSESVTAIPNANVVDWILLEIRDAAQPQLANANSVIERKAAFILKNGQIVDLDGISNVPITQTINQQLFLVLKNRNHLAIMSSTALQPVNDVYQYDFTSGSNKAYGGINSQKQLSTGVWGMISGDGNQDGIINNSDKNLTWKPDSGEKIYSSGDFNLNGNINNQDKNLIWISNFGRVSYIP